MSTSRPIKRQKAFSLSYDDDEEMIESRSVKDPDSSEISLQNETIYQSATNKLITAASNIQRSSTLTSGIDATMEQWLTTNIQMATSVRELEIKRDILKN